MPPPTMYKFDVSQFPIMFLAVASSDMDPRQLRHFVEKQVQYRLERVPGVAQFTVRGGLRRQIQVNLDLDKLRALNLPVSQVVDIVRRENLNRPVGPVNEGRFEVLLRTQGEYRNLDQIRSLVLTTRNGVPVYMRDIATVEDSHEEVRQMTSVDGKPSVRLFVYKQSGANTVKVSDAVWEEIRDIHRDYPNVRITNTGDSADFIRAAINNVKDSAVLGSLLAVLILLLFLRSFSSTLIIGVAIPISVIATFALMYFNGFTLNTISFGGLALGVGMLVDNSIVVLENIFRHRTEEGKSPYQAALDGSKEVGTAIIASTLTTIAVFVPVLFLSGVSVVTFQQLAWVVSFSLACSLVVALTVVPVLCSKYLRSSGGTGLPVIGAAARWAGQAQDKLAESYGNLLRSALAHRYVVIGVALVLFVGAIWMAPLIGVELSPQADEGEIRVDVEMEPGSRVEVVDAMMQRLSAIVRENVPEVETLMVESGGSGGFGRTTGNNNGELRIRLKERAQRQREAKQIANEIRPKLSIMPGMTVRTRVSQSMMNRGSRSGSQGGDRLEVEIRGHDLEVLQDLANKVRDVMLTVPGVPEVQLSRTPGQPEMLVSVDRIKASTLGLNVSDIADALETAIGGRRTSMYRQQGDEFDILVRLQEKDRLQLSQVGKVPLVALGGRTIPAETVTQMRRQEGPVSIQRANQERIIAVSGTLGDRDLGSVVRDLDVKLRQIPRPEGYDISYGGEYEEQQKAFRELTFAAILALILVYMVMASQFESLRDPFIILFSIPLAAIGVILVLVTTHTTFNMQGFLGVIMLAGIVVNNAIILIDYMNQLRRDHGMSVKEAVVVAGARRLRPVLMTTGTTVLGLLPMAMGVGEGSELQAPLARVVIGGLTSSTLITLVLIPVIYAMLEGRTEHVPATEPVPVPHRLEPAQNQGD
jgi:HAE1 family hydrophobic/amphiphilic exporter-1